MTATSTATDRPFTVVFDDETRVEGKLRRVDAGPTWAKHRVSIVLDEADTTGHAFEPTAVAISLRFDDDVEGHALSLHFPTPQEADAFRRRLVATGILAGALVVGVTAAQLSTAAAAPTSVAAPVPIVQTVPLPAPAANPRIPAEDLAPAAPLTAPAINPVIPAEDLAPTTSTRVAAPAANPRIPADDLAPAAPAVPKAPPSNTRAQ